MPKSRKKPLDIIYRNGKPVAVVLDINSYEMLLERLEDAGDLKMLHKLRQKPLTYRKLDDFLAECAPHV